MRRAKWGIGAVAVAGLAWLLSTLFNVDLGGLGLSRFAAVENGGPPAETTTTEENEAKTNGTSESAGEEQPVSTTNPTASGGAAERVEIRIVDREYRLPGGGGESARWVPATLEEAVAAAKRASGDESGVRVRMLRTPSARASAEEALLEALAKAGVRSSEITKPGVDFDGAAGD